LGRAKGRLGAEGVASQSETQSEKNLTTEVVEPPSMRGGEGPGAGEPGIWCRNWRCRKKEKKKGGPRFLSN